MELTAQLRAEVEPLTGPARLPGLLRLAQELATRCVTSVPGRPEAEPYLDEGVAVLEEAYGYARPGDPLRSHIAVTLGHLLSLRCAVHGGARGDCDRGIELLRAAVESGCLRGLESVVSRVLLGQLYLSRVVAFLESQQDDIAAGGYSPAEAIEDAGRAEAHLREVIDGDPVSDDLVTAARTMVEIALVVRSLLRVMSGDADERDMSRLTGMVATMKQWRERMAQGGGLGYRLPSNLMDISLSQLTAADPTEWPIAVVVGQEPPDEAAVTGPAAVAAHSADPDLDSLRGRLYALLPAGAAWQAAADLLLPGSPTPDVATVDEMVALASILVECPGFDLIQAAIDTYVLAVAVLLRGRVNDHPTEADRRAGAKALLAAARGIPPGHPAEIVILLSLGAFLNETRPLASIDAAVADAYADRLDIAIAGDVPDPGDLATLRALRGVCRSAAALAQVRGAVGDVPLAYPWSASIKAISQLTCA